MENPGLEDTEGKEPFEDEYVFAPQTSSQEHHRKLPPQPSIHATLHENLGSTRRPGGRSRTRIPPAHQNIAQRQIPFGTKSAKINFRPKRGQHNSTPGCPSAVPNRDDDEAGPTGLTAVGRKPFLYRLCRNGRTGQASHSAGKCCWGRGGSARCRPPDEVVANM